MEASYGRFAARSEIVFFAIFTFLHSFGVPNYLAATFTGVDSVMQGLVPIGLNHCRIRTTNREKVRNSALETSSLQGAFSYSKTYGFSARRRFRTVIPSGSCIARVVG